MIALREKTFWLVKIKAAKLMTDCSLNLLTFRSCLLPSVLFSLSPFMWVLKLNLSLASSLLGRICLLTSKFQGNLVPVSPALGLQLHTLLLFFYLYFYFLSWVSWGSNSSALYNEHSVIFSQTKE